MQYAKRIIPVLQIADRRLIKTKNFAMDRYLGDPLNAVRIFNLKQAQELIVLDIGATESRQIDFEYLQKIAAEAFVPLAYGGGIESIEQVHHLYQLGFDRIILNTATIENPQLITQIADVYGTQSVICALEVTLSGNGQYLLNYAGGKKKVEDHTLSEFVQKLIALGAGEILIYNKQRDGTYMGLDHNLIREIAHLSTVPIIACGGASSINDINSALASGASAVAAGSLFSFYGKHKAVLINYYLEEK